MDQKKLVKIRNLVFDVMLFIEDPATIDWGSVSVEDVEDLYLELKKECEGLGIGEDEQVE